MKTDFIAAVMKSPWPNEIKFAKALGKISIFGHADCKGVWGYPLSINDTKNIARIANAVPVTLYSRVTMNVEIVVLNCQKCNQCLKCHKSFGLVFEGVL